jgi:hypothetical protein
MYTFGFMLQNQRYTPGLSAVKSELFETEYTSAVPPEPTPPIGTPPLAENLF